MDDSTRFADPVSRKSMSTPWSRLIPEKEPKIAAAPNVIVLGAGGTKRWRLLLLTLKKTFLSLTPVGRKAWQRGALPRQAGCRTLKSDTRIRNQG
jgi:hypothetical protein